MRWDSRYRGGAYSQRPWPSEFVRQSLPRIAQTTLVADNGANPLPQALDVACGRGRNSLFLAEHGYRVHGVDVSPVALAYGATIGAVNGMPISWQCRDLMGADVEFPQSQYQLIILVRFVAPHLIPKMVAALAPQGHLLIEEHMQFSGDIEAGRTLIGPSSQRYRVPPGELQRLVDSTPFDLEPVYWFEGLIDEPDGSLVALTRLHVQRRG